jgi:hypothetical protein
MAKRKDEVPEAPACVHDEIDAYIAEYRRRDGKLGDKLNGE